MKKTLIFFTLETIFYYRIVILSEVVDFYKNQLRSRKILLKILRLRKTTPNVVFLRSE